MRKILRWFGRWADWASDIKALVSVIGAVVAAAWAQVGLPGIMMVACMCTLAWFAIFALRRGAYSGAPPAGPSAPTEPGTPQSAEQNTPQPVESRLDRRARLATELHQRFDARIGSCQTALHWIESAIAAAQDSEPARQLVEERAAEYYDRIHGGTFSDVLDAFGASSTRSRTFTELLLRFMPEDRFAEVTWHSKHKEVTAIRDWISGMLTSFEEREMAEHFDGFRNPQED